MEIKTFWKIIIKGIGLWLAMNCVYVIPQFASTFAFDNGYLRWESLLTVWAATIGTLIIYIIVTRIFLFKTDWIIKTFKLDENFPQEKIDINISYKTVLSIVVIIIGALLFINGLPSLISGIYDFLRQKELFKNYSETSWLIFYFLKTLFGYLIMTNNGFVVKIIDKEKAKLN